MAITETAVLAQERPSLQQHLHIWARGGEWRLNGAPAGTLGVLQTPSESQ